MKYCVVDTKTGEKLKTFKTLKAAHKYEDECIRDFQRPTFGIEYVKTPTKRSKLKRKA